MKLHETSQVIQELDAKSMKVTELGEQVQGQ